jgi:hypothetical protein
MFYHNAFAFLYFSFIVSIVLIQFGNCVKSESKSRSSSSSSPASNNHQEVGASSSKYPYHSPTKFAKGLRRNEKHHTKLYVMYSDKIGSTNNPYHQVIYNSHAKDSFLRSRKSAEKAERMEKVAKRLRIDSKFSVKDQPRTRLQAKKLQESQHAAGQHAATSSHSTDRNSDATS